MASLPAAARKSNAPVLAGLLLGILLAALDQTVVGTSLGKIVASVGGFEHFAWLFSAYMLASTVVIPLAGKFSDIFGRRPVYLAGMAVFLLGSALCGTATSMTQLIVYRAIQGLGGGAIFPVAIATIADLYPPSQRGKIGGLFGAVFGLSSVVGPFLGGWIVDYVHVFGVESWRWVFYVNLPVGVVAIAMVAAFFPRLDNRHKVPIDYAGIATLTLAIVSLLLITIWGGDLYAWDSPQVMGLAALTLAAMAAFLVVERRAADPVIPLHLFRNPIFTVSMAASLLSGAAMFTIISFMPTYLQGVVGMSATNSGSALVPLSLGIVLGSAGSGALMRRFGYKPFAVAGFLIAFLGYLALSRLGEQPPIWLAIAEMAVLGLGIGFTIQTFIIATQNAIERKYIGVSTSSVTLFRTLGATLGVTALGTVLNRRLQAEIPARVDEPVLSGMLQNPFIDGKVERVPSLLLQPGFKDALVANLERFQQMPHEQAVLAADKAIQGIKLSYAAGMEVIFLVGAGIAAVAFVVALFLKSIPMKSPEEYLAGDAGKAPGPGH